MTQEEKAKVDNNVCDERYCCVIDDIVPELIESEDERIRKALIELVQGMYMGCCTEEAGKERDMFLTWLEKQGEQNLANSAKTCKDEQNPNPCDGCINRKGCINCENGELRETEQKPAWSEDDEVALGDALWCCKQAASIAKDENDMGNVWYAEHWLKSIKDRYTWKPSEEHLHWLKWAINRMPDTEIANEAEAVLEDLLEQLKKLR